MFTIFGIEVKPRLAFFLVIGFIGFGFVPRLDLLPIWMGVAFLSVLIHELGHALVARRFGSEPAIEFLFFGAVTKFPAKGITPGRNAVIAIAGPLAGIAAALPGALWMLSLVGPMNTMVALLDPAQGFAVLSQEAGPWVGVAVWSLTWTGGVWGILNLVPVRSVDGGQVLAGVVKTLTPRFGVPITEGLFAVTFLLGLGWALATRNWWIGLLMFLFGAPNLREVRAWWERRQDGPAFDLIDQAQAAYDSGDMDRARQLADQAHATARSAGARRRADPLRVGGRLALGRTREAADIAEASPGLDPRIKLQTFAAAGRYQQVIDLVGSSTGLSPGENASVIFALAALGRDADAQARATREPADIGLLLQALRSQLRDDRAASILAHAIRSNPAATTAQRAEAALLAGDPGPVLAAADLDSRLTATALAMAGGLAAVDERYPDLELRAVPSVQVALHRSRRFDDAVRFAERHRFSDRNGLIAYNRAASEAQLGRRDAALDSLRAARRAGFDITLARRDDDFDPIREAVDGLLD